MSDSQDDDVEDGQFFSKGLRDALEPFGEMDVTECLESVDFMKALCKHAGMSDEKFNQILDKYRE